MKVLHFIIGKANPNRANGVNYVIHGLAKYTTLAGHDVTVVGVSKGMKDSYELVERDNFEVHVYNSFFGSCFKDLKKFADEADVVHLHSVWQHYNIIFANHLIKIKKPYIVTIHSGLTIDRIKQSNYLLKILYHKLFQKKIFDRANGIQALTREEISDISIMTQNKNIFFVSNGIDLDHYRIEPKKYFTDVVEKITFAYLGRFGVEKNISNLILAISELPENYLKKIECHLIGPIDKKADQLKKIIKKLKLEKTVIFVGPMYEKEKKEKLSSLDFYVHPATSDVVSIAVMEALACGLPCVISRTSQVSYYYNSNAFLMTEPLIEEIKKSLIEMIDKKDEWKEMSSNALELVKDVFNWDASVNKLIIEYKSILNK
jgi:glycosyltransferase involved in cell wall biosynthesis